MEKAKIIVYGNGFSEWINKVQSSNNSMIMTFSWKKERKRKTDRKKKEPFQ